MGNGELLDLAELEDYKILATTDRISRRQQHPERRKIGIMVLLSTNWPKIRRSTREGG